MGILVKCRNARCRNKPDVEILEQFEEHREKYVRVYCPSCGHEEELSLADYKRRGAEDKFREKEKKRKKKGKIESERYTDEICPSCKKYYLTKVKYADGSEKYTCRQCRTSYTPEKLEERNPQMLKLKE